MAPPIAGASSLNVGTERVAGGAFADAFSHMGLHRLPEQGSRQRGRGEMDDVFNFGGNGKERSSSAKTKTGLLAQNHPPLNPPETSLLRDLPFTLQGLSSTNLPFVSISSLTLPPTLPPPIVSLLHTLAEPSLLYRGLSAFLQSLEGGLVGQSLRAALGEELRAYLGLVTALEGEIRRALAMADTNEPQGGIGKAAVTLKRCVIWTREATMGLRLMSLMVEKSKSKYLTSEHGTFNTDKLPRQKGRSINIDDTRFFVLAWRSICWSFCGKTFDACDTPFLRHAAPMDL
jgi:gamma-tubulin complex component 3